MRSPRGLSVLLGVTLALLSGSAAAGLGETLPKLFLDVVNKAIRGRIAPETIRYKAPTSLVLENAKLYDPRGGEVASLKRAVVNVAVSELFVGNITIEDLDVEGALLRLKRQNGELNLLSALEPVKPSDGSKSSLKVKLTDIQLTGGAFRYDDRDAELKIEASGISGRGTVLVNLKTDSVNVDARAVRVREGVVRLEQLDVPFRDVRLDRFSQRNQKLNLSSANGRALDGTFTCDGQIRTSGAGALELSGVVRTPRGAWPDRLKKLPFPSPELDGNYRVTGPLADPTVDVSASLGAVRAYDLRATRGSARVLIDKRKVRIRRAGLSLGTGAQENLTATGDYTIKNAYLALDVQLTGVPLVELVRSAELDDPPRGSVSGAARVTGTADGEAALEIAPRVTLKGARGFNLSLPETVVTGRVFASPARVDLVDVTATGSGVDATVRGHIDLDKKRLDLEAEVDARQVHSRVLDLPEKLTIARASGKVTVVGPYKDPRVRGPVRVHAADAWGVPLRDARAALEATRRRTVLSGLSATVAGGALTGAIELDTRRVTEISGRVELQRARLEALKVTDDPLPVTGEVTAFSARLSGPAKKPVVAFSLSTGPLVAEGEQLGAARARGIATREDLTLNALELTGGVARATTTTPVWLRFDDGALAGQLRFSVDDLARVAAAEDKARGALEGEVRLAGTLEVPDVYAELIGRDIVAAGVDLGALDAVARLVPDAVRGRAAQVSATVQGPAGSMKVRAAYALERERVHAVVRVVEADLAPWLRQIPDTVAPLQGVLSGRVVVRGKPRAPDLEVNLRVPELSLPVAVAGDSTADQMRGARALGPASVKGSWIGGQLDMTICASPSNLKRPAGPCGKGFPVWVTATGPVDLEEESLDLELALSVAHDDVEELVIPLRDLGLHLDAALSGVGRVRWRWSAEDRPRINGDYTLEGATVEMEGAPRVELQAPARIAIARNRVTFVDELRFKAGEGTLRLGGSASAENLDLTLRGDVGTPLLKLYTDEITVARGEVSADLAITGPPSALHLAGSLEPKEDAAVGVRTLRQTVVLEEGKVLFTLEGGVQRVNIPRDAPLRASIGDGRVRLYGEVEISFPDTGERSVRFDRWDLHANATDLFIRSGTTFVETNANLDLMGPRGGAVLAGNIDVSDGSIRETFDLRNFVLESTDDEPTRPLHERFAIVDLDQLRLDLAIAVRNFRARAELGTFPLDLTAAGDLRATGTLEVPQLTGALEVLSGELVLPRARFDVSTARFEWSSERPGLMPRIFVSALAELPPQGTCDVDIPVELTLEGDDLDRIDLGLSAADSGGAHTRSDLLKAVLAGVPLPACSDDAQNDFSVAWRALLSPVSTQVSREIEALLAGSVGGDFTINPFFDGQRIATDVRWDLGRRVQLEGETGIRAGRDVVTDDEIPIAGADVRMRLLLWDPFLFGKELFLEGELNSQQDATNLNTRIETRLKWRIFER